MFRIFLIFVSSALLVGCSTVNFSANYYTPPEDYETQVLDAWNSVKAKLHLKNEYQITFIEGLEAHKLKGIPAISNRTIAMPRDFVKYVFQNYHDDRFTILTSVIAHEVCHGEFNLPSEPPHEHLKTDLAAIKILGEKNGAAENYSKSLLVMKSYWFARKGMAGHALNLGMNAVSVASMFYGGPGMFGDLYATDLSARIKWIRKQYKIKSSEKFERSQGKVN